MNVMTSTQQHVPTADEAFGLVVHTVMFRQRITQTKLAAALGIHQAALSKKIHGERPWTLEDMIRVADGLRVDLRELLAQMWQDPGAPAGAAGGRSAGAPPAGIEPATYRLEGGRFDNIVPLHDARRSRAQEVAACGQSA